MTRRADLRFDSLEGGVGLSLKLEWLGDRYGHSIWAVTENGELLVARSEEILSEEIGKNRPAFQELSLERMGERDVCCLVGMSGKTYWSASIEPLNTKRGFLFDICCRGSEDAGSAYVFLSAVKSDREGSFIISQADSWCCRLEPIELENFVTRLQQNASRIEVFSESKQRSGVATVRWKYVWQMETVKEFA